MNRLWDELSIVNKLAEDREIRAFLIVVGLQALATGWTLGTYVLFILSHGYSLLHVTLANFVFMSVDAIFNPYTGNLADRYGQKKVFLGGQAFWFGGMFAYGMSSTFVGFISAEAIAAIGAALMSDALESWLCNLKGEDTYREVRRRSGPISSLGIIPTAALGGLVGATMGYQWPWLLSGISGVVVLVIGYKLLAPLPEGFEHHQAKAVKVKEVFIQSLKVKPLRFIGVITFGIAVCVQPFNMFWQPVMEKASGSAWWLGLMWIGIAMMSSIGAYWGTNQGNGGGTVKMILLTGAPMVMTNLVGGRTGPLLALFLGHEIGRGAYKPVLDIFAQGHIPNHMRSTTNSLLSSTRTIGCACGLLIFGYLTCFIEPIQIWSIAASALIILAVYAGHYVWSEK